MARRLTASDRAALIRLASSLPSGSEERKSILAGLKVTKPLRAWKFDQFFQVKSAIRMSVDGLAEARITYSTVNDEGFYEAPKYYYWDVKLNGTGVKSGKAKTLQLAMDAADIYLQKKGYVGTDNTMARLSSQFAGSPERKAILAGLQTIPKDLKYDLMRMGHGVADIIGNTVICYDRDSALSASSYLKSLGMRTTRIELTDADLGTEGPGKIKSYWAFDVAGKAILAGLAKKATKSKVATDPQEMADVLSLSLKKGQDYSYEDLLGILVEESGTRQAARYLESAIEILVSDGILRRTPSGYRRG